MNTDNDCRIVTLEPDGSMKIDKHSEAESELRTAQLRGDEKNKTGNTCFSDSMRNVKAVDNKKIDDRKQDKKTDCKKDMVRSSAATISSYKDNVEKHLKSRNLEEKPTEIVNKKDIQKVPADVTR